MKTYKLKDTVTDEMLDRICIRFDDCIRDVRSTTFKLLPDEEYKNFGGLECSLISTDTSWNLVIPMSYAEEIIEAKDQKTSDRTLEVISKDLADAMNKVRALELEFEEYVKDQGRKNGIDIEIEITGYNS